MSEEIDTKINELSEKFKALKAKAIEKGLSEEEVVKEFLKGTERTVEKATGTSTTNGSRNWKIIVIILLFPILLASLLYQFRESLDFFDETSPCAVENGVFVMEAARPVARCSLCAELTEIPKLEKLSRERFVDEFAYSGRPLVVKDATKNWTAINIFSFEFFRDLYGEEALNVTDEECQFFPYQTNFNSLREVFNMSKARSEFKAEPWYIGWSNCDGTVRKELRKHYRKPYFIPPDSEHSEIDWIFMGGVGPGANIHLDSVERPSWQAQLSGRKTWTLIPPPECEHVCQSFNITIERGEIVVVDTNQWYHSTTVEPGEISITIGSEYD